MKNPFYHPFDDALFANYSAFIPAEDLCDKFRNLESPFTVYGIEGSSDLWYRVEDVKLVYGAIKFKQLQKTASMAVVKEEDVYIVSNQNNLIAQLN